uniref:C-type lectin domain-containing protein n=1 Tax=Salmo trutta TaxID=8032 RepID=A0A673W6F6_SALTR
MSEGFSIWLFICVSFTGLLITALCAVVSCCLNKQFHYVNEGGKTWEKAQQYCREKYIDLAFISNQQEADEVNNISKTDYVWIGLYRDPSHPTEWKWSGGWNSSFRFWGKGQPNNIFGNQDCVSVWKKNMNDDQCTEQHPFLCFDLNVVLALEETDRSYNTYEIEPHSGSVIIPIKPRGQTGKWFQSFFHR